MSTSGGSAPLGFGDIEYPKKLRDIITKAKTSWLRNQEVADILQNYRAYNFKVSTEPAVQPAGVENYSRIPVSGYPAMHVYNKSLVRARRLKF